MNPVPLAGQQLQHNGNRSITQDSLQAIEYFNIADTSWKNVDSCLYYSQLAIPLLKKTGQWEKYVHCLAGRSYCYNVKEQYDSMEVNNRLAYEEAQKYLTPNSYLYIAVINNLGIVYSNVRQDYKQAIRHYQTALSLFDSTNTHDAVKGTLLKNLGDIYLKRGDFDRAIIHFKEALTHFERAFRAYVNKNTGSYFKIAEVYQSLARVYQYQRNYSEATRYLKEMLALMDRNARDFDTGYYAYCYTQLAENALAQKKITVAGNYLGQAARLNGLTPQQRAVTDRLYSQLNLARHEWNIAHQYADLALDRMPATKRIDRSGIFHTKGQIFFREERYAEALSAFQSAAELLIAGLSFSLETARLDPDWNILSRIELIDQLQAMGQCLEALYEKEKDVAMLEKALNGFLLISELSDQLRTEYQSEESKIFLSETTYPFFEHGITLAYRLFQIRKDREYLERAFYLSEKSKAAVLLEEIRAKEAAGIFTIPPAFIEEEYRLRTDRNYYGKLLDGAEQDAQVSSEKLKSWNSKILEIDQRREQLQEQLALNYPNYAALTQSVIPTLPDLQKACLPGSAAIQYFLGKDRSYAFLITPETVVLKELAGEETLSSQVSNLLGLLKMNTTDDLALFQNVAHRLYLEILGPFDLSGVQKLTIVPHGSLSYLPFEILLPLRADSDHPKQLNYLLQSKTISYAYSLALWQLQQGAPAGGGKALVLAPVFPQDPLRHLRFSTQQIDAFEGVRHTTLQYEAANIDNFMRYAPKYDLVHFSTHATAGDAVHQQPAIDLFDGPLFLSDLYTMQLSSDLVVLSACQTGIGDLRKGEGVMSLARGFTYAGVPSVMTTLWKVNEKATNLIIQEFYKQLSMVNDKDEALRQAKLNYLQQCEDVKAPPYYWAGFVLIGNTRAFTFEKDFPWGRLLLILAFSAVVFLVLRKYIRKENWPFRS